MFQKLNSSLVALALGTALFAQAAPGAGTNTAQTADQAESLGTTPFLEGELIVRFQGGADPFAALAEHAPGRYFVDSQLIAGLDLYLVRVLDGTSSFDAVRDLRQNPAIRYANPDHVVSERQTVPNDVSFGNQWSKHNTGQSGGTLDADIDAPEAWDLGTGSKDFTIAIVDGGFSLSHADLVGNIYTNQLELNGSAGVDDDGNGYIDDIHGWNAYNQNGTIPGNSHGTHVSGIAGADGNNGVGVAGVNWQVTLLPVAGSSSSTSVVLRAYGYCMAQKSLWQSSGGTLGTNVVVTNSSFGIDYADCDAAPYTQWNDAYNAMGALGILSAAATANRNINIDQTGDVPTSCSSEYLVTVTNTTRTDGRASAGYGQTTIDLGAPGSSIYSTLPSGYGQLSGTSMATPQVAGAVAFLHSVASTSFATLRQNDPAFAAREIKRMLLDNVDPIASLNNITVSNGRLNLHSSALKASSYSNGAVAVYGLGLHGSNIGSLSYNSGSPIAGSSVLLDISGIPNGGVGLILFSPQPASLSVLGGTLLVDLAQIAGVLPFNLVAGSAQVSVPLPLGAVGFVAYGQGGAFDPTQSQNFALTNGVSITIGQ